MSSVFSRTSRTDPDLVMSVTGDVDGRVEQMLQYANLNALVRGAARHIRWDGTGGLLYSDEHEDLHRLDRARGDDELGVEGARLWQLPCA